MGNPPAASTWPYSYSQYAKAHTQCVWLPCTMHASVHVGASDQAGDSETEGGPGHGIAQSGLPLMTQSLTAPI